MNLIKMLAAASSNKALDVFSSSNLDNARRMTISGNKLCVITYYDRLTVIDITTPSSMSESGTLQNATFLTGANAIGVSGNYALITASTDEFVCSIDISTPSSMSVDGWYDSDNPYGLAISGDYAYTTKHSGTGNLLIKKLDISSLPTITLDDTIDITYGAPFDVAVDSTRLVFLTESAGWVASIILSTFTASSGDENSELSLSDGSRIYTDQTNHDGYCFVTLPAGGSDYKVMIFTSAGVEKDTISFGTTKPIALAFDSDYMYVLDSANITRVDITDKENAFKDGTYRNSSMQNGADLLLDGTEMYVLKDGSIVSLTLADMF